MNKNNIFIIGIAGASGCGKTYFANSIKNKILESYNDNIIIEIISCDNYYKPYNGGKAPDDFNWDLPNSLEIDLLINHLDQIKKGEIVNIPRYNFLTSQREGIITTIGINNEKDTITIIIVEGLFVLFDENLRKKFDLKIFTLLDPDICLARRLQRDVEERKICYKKTIEQYQNQVKPSYVNFIEPTKRFADIIISTSEFTDTTKSIEILNSYIVSKLKW